MVVICWSIVVDRASRAKGRAASLNSRSGRIWVGAVVLYNRLILYMDAK